MNAEVKGVGLRGFLKYIKLNYEPGIADFLSNLPDAERKVFESPILNSKWYPYSAFTSLLKVMDDEMGSGDLSECRRYGANSADLDMSSIFKVFFKVGSPQFIIKRSDWFWKQYYRPGSMKVPETTNTSVRIQVLEFPIVKHHCKVMEGWMEKALEMAGGKNTRMKEVQCRNDGAPYCEYIGEWDK
jgi:hypothetical protein